MKNKGSVFGVCAAAEQGVRAGRSVQAALLSAGSGLFFGMLALIITAALYTGFTGET